MIKHLKIHVKYHYVEITFEMYEQEHEYVCIRATELSISNISTQKL